MAEYWQEERYATPRERLLDMRVEALEDRLEQMRLSRRVLLQILEKCENDHRGQIENLKNENQRLQREIRRLHKQAGNYAAEIMEKNRLLAANTKY